MTAFGLFVDSSVLLLAATMHAVPWISRRERLFGATVTDPVRVARQRVKLIRQYQLRQLPWTTAALAGVVLRGASHPSWLAGLMLMLLIAGTTNLWHAFDHVPKVAGADRIRIVDLELSVEPSGGSWLVPLLLLPLVPLASTGAWLYAHWAQIPQRLPVHWNLQGEPNRWVERTPAAVYAPLAIGAAAVLTIVALTLAVRWGGRRSAWSPAVMTLVLIVSSMVGGVFTMLGLLPLHSFFPAQIVGFVGAMMGALVVTIVITLRRTRRVTAPPGEITPDTCWHGGIFYYNPGDPALLVEKRVGVGWTFNFANPLAWVLIALLVLVPLSIAVVRMQLT